MSERSARLRDAYDVVIVGSGPAGGAAANALSGHGLGTVILERQELPRYKMCSGLLFPSAVAIVTRAFGGVPQEVRSKPSGYRGLRLFPTNDSQMMELPVTLTDTGPDHPDTGFSVSRAEFDYWLCRQSDAEIVDQCRFEGVSEDDGGFVLKVHDGERDVTVRARYLVGGDGATSKVRKAAFPGFDNGVGFIPNYEEWYVGSADLEPEWLYMFCDREVTGYFASLFNKDGQWIAATGARQGESIKSIHQAFVAHLKKRHGLRIEEKTQHSGITIHDMSATGNYCLGRGNVLLAGEAAGLNRAAEGITSALISGRAAGESILASIKSGKPAMTAYPEALEDEMTQIQIVNRMLEGALGYNFFTRD